MYFNFACNFQCRQQNSYVAETREGTSYSTNVDFRDVTTEEVTEIPQPPATLIVEPVTHTSDQNLVYFYLEATSLGKITCSLVILVYIII